MWLGLKPSQNLSWDLNPHGRDLNPAKTHSIWFQGLVMLRFLMSHHRKKFSEIQSVRGGFTQIQREAHSTDRVWAISEGE